MRHGGIAILRGAVRVKNHRAAKPFRLHLLEVVRDGSFGDIAVKPPPVGAEPRVVRRVLPAGFQIIFRAGQERNRNNGKSNQPKKEFF